MISILPLHLNCGPRTSRVSITGEPARYADPQAPNPSQKLHVNKIPGRVLCTLQFEKHSASGCQQDPIHMDDLPV